MSDNLFTNINSWLGSTPDNARGMWVEIKKGSLKGQIQWINRKEYKFFSHCGRLQVIFEIMKIQLTALSKENQVTTKQLKDLIALKNRVTTKFLNYQKAHSTFILGFFYRILFARLLSKHYQAIIQNINACLNKHVSNLPLDEFKKIIKSIPLSQLDLDKFSDEKKTLVFNENLNKFDTLEDKEKKILYRYVAKMSDVQIRILLDKGEHLKEINIKSLETDKKKFIISYYIEKLAVGQYPGADNLKVLFTMIDHMKIDEFRLFIRCYYFSFDTDSLTPEQVIVCLEENAKNIKDLNREELNRVMHLISDNFLDKLHEKTVQQLNLADLLPKQIVLLRFKLSQEQINRLNLSTWKEKEIQDLFGSAADQSIRYKLRASKCVSTILFDSWDMISFTRFVNEGRNSYTQDIDCSKVLPKFFSYIIYSAHYKSDIHHLNLAAINDQSWNDQDRTVFSSLPIQRLTIDVINRNINYFFGNSFKELSLNQLAKISLDNANKTSINQILTYCSQAQVQVIPLATIKKNISKIDSFSKFSTDQIRNLNLNLNDLTYSQLADLKLSHENRISFSEEQINQINFSKFSGTEVSYLWKFLRMNTLAHIQSFLNKIPFDLYKEITDKQCSHINYKNLSHEQKFYFKKDQLEKMQNYELPWAVISTKIDSLLLFPSTDATHRDFLLQHVHTMSIMQFERMAKQIELIYFENAIYLLTQDKKKILYDCNSKGVRAGKETDLLNRLRGFMSTHETSTGSNSEKTPDDIETSLNSSLNSSDNPEDAKRRAFLLQHVHTMTDAQFQRLVENMVLKYFDVVVDSLSEKRKKILFDYNLTRIRVGSHVDVLFKLRHLMDTFEKWACFLGRTQYNIRNDLKNLTPQQLAWVIEINSNSLSIKRDYLNLGRLPSHDLERAAPYFSISWLKAQNCENVKNFIHYLSFDQMKIFEPSAAFFDLRNFYFKGWTTEQILDIFKTNFADYLPIGNINFSRWPISQVRKFLIAHPFKVSRMNWTADLFTRVCEDGYKFDVRGVPTDNFSIWPEASISKYFELLPSLQYLPEAIIESYFNQIPSEKLRTLSNQQIMNISFSRLSVANIQSLINVLETGKVHFISAKNIHENMEKISDFSKFSIHQIEQLIFARLALPIIKALSARCRLTPFNFSRMGKIDISDLSTVDVIAISAFVPNFTNIANNLFKLQMDDYVRISNEECIQIDYNTLESWRRSYFTEAQISKMKNNPTSKASQGSSSSSSSSHSSSSGSAGAWRDTTGQTKAPKKEDGPSDTPSEDYIRMFGKTAADRAETAPSAIWSSVIEKTILELGSNTSPLLPAQFTQLRTLLRSRGSLVTTWDVLEIFDPLIRKDTNAAKIKKAFINAQKLIHADKLDASIKAQFEKEANTFFNLVTEARAALLSQYSA